MGVVINMLEWSEQRCRALLRRQETTEHDWLKVKLLAEYTEASARHQKHFKHIRRLYNTNVKVVSTTDTERSDKNIVGRGATIVRRTKGT